MRAHTPVEQSRREKFGTPAHGTGTRPTVGSRDISVERILELQRVAGNAALQHILADITRRREDPVTGTDGEVGHRSPDRSEREVEAGATRALRPVGADPRSPSGESPPILSAAGPGELARGEAAPGSRMQTLADTVGSAGPTVESAGLTVQRRVGFEFESAEWNPWLLASDEGEEEKVESFYKGDVLHTGQGYRLESDTSLPGRATSEFVTDPFDEVPAGRDALRRSLDSMLRIATRLDKYVGRTGPDRSRTELGSLKSRFVLPSEHRLEGSADVPAQKLLLSGGEVGFPVRMQSTAGLPLADLSMAMESLGRAPEGTPSEEKQRKVHRATMYPPDQVPRLADWMIGRAPSVARKTILELAKRPEYAQVLARDTTELTGWLSAMAMFVMALSRTKKGEEEMVKYYTPLMPRNSFSQMFETLPMDQKVVLAQSADLLLKEFIAALNWVGAEKVQADSSLYKPHAEVATHPSHAVLAKLTVGKWVTGIVDGSDHFSVPGMMQRLAGHWDVSAEDKDMAVRRMTSIGEYARGDERPETGESLFLFENRAIDPNPQAYPDRRMPLKDAAEHAMKIFTMYMDFRSIGSARSSSRSFMEQAFSGGSW